MRLRRLVRQLHRWLGLIVGLQLLFWVGGGLIMSSLSLDAVRGRDRAAAAGAAPLVATAGLLGPAEVLSAHPGTQTLSLTQLLGAPVYRLESATGTTLIDAVSGRTLSPLPRETAEAVARADYAGAGTLAGVEWIDTPGSEYRGLSLPLWRVRMDDARNTSLYVSPHSGTVVARRNRLWRVFDFVWMLHIMDYRERDDFNHPLLVTSAATALLFVLTGVMMLAYSFRPSQVRARR